MTSADRRSRSRCRRGIGSRQTARGGTRCGPVDGTEPRGTLESRRQPRWLSGFDFTPWLLTTFRLRSTGTRVGPLAWASVFVPQLMLVSMTSLPPRRCSLALLTMRTSGSPEYRKFPYLVLFRVRPNAVHVVGLFHSATDPKKWRRRARNGDGATVTINCNRAANRVRPEVRRFFGRRPLNRDVSWDQSIVNSFFTYR